VKISDRQYYWEFEIPTNTYIVYIPTYKHTDTYMYIYVGIEVLKQSILVAPFILSFNKKTNYFS
jgi:hypothetical protein